MQISYKSDNKKRDALYGKPDKDAPVDTSELADKVLYPRVLAHGSMLMPVMVLDDRLPNSATRRRP